MGLVAGFSGFRFSGFRCPFLKVVAKMEKTVSAKELRRRRCFRRWLADYYAAYQAWWERAEYETMFYATELALFKLDFPAPRLSDWMKIQKGYYAS